MMSTPKSSKGNNVKARQTVMGDFFSKGEKSEKYSTRVPRKEQKSPTKGIETRQKKSPDQKTEKPTKETGKKSPEVANKRKEVVGKGNKGVENKTNTFSAKEKKAVGKETKTLDKEGTGIQKKPDKAVEKKTSLKRKVTGAGMFSFSWTRGAQRDTEDYRNGYPGKNDNLHLNDNLRFYLNQIPSKPDGDFIDKIHVDWWGDYRLLEIHHGYIQWLFPIRESGLNWHAQELQLHEIQKLQKSRKAVKRILTSYKMMLDFYGMLLENEEDGTIRRAENWRDRFQHLNRSYHNYLRITRILKCLGEFGLEHLKKNFVKFVLSEGLEEGTLSNLIDSCVKYWIGVLKEDEDREEMFDYYEKLAYDENLSAKRRNRSPSPPSSYRLNWSTNSKTDKKVISKAVVNKKGNSSNEKNEKRDDDEFSDNDEDSTLYYAMSLIDDDNDDNNIADSSGSKSKDMKLRKEHEISDQSEDENIPAEESLEMEHWNNEAKKANTEELEGGSEFYDSTEEADEVDGACGPENDKILSIGEENEKTGMENKGAYVDKEGHESQKKMSVGEKAVNKQPEVVNEQSEEVKEGKEDKEALDEDVDKRVSIDHTDINKSLPVKETVKEEYSKEEKMDTSET